MKEDKIETIKEENNLELSLDEILKDSLPEYEGINDSISSKGGNFEKTNFIGHFSKDLRHKERNPNSEKALEKKEFRSALKNAFQDKIVVDIGASEETAGYRLAKEYCAKGYVALNIDEGSHNMFEVYMKKLEKVGTKKEDIPYKNLLMDGLTFLEALKDNSISVMVGGITGFIIKDEEYREKFSKEIKRVLHPDGGFLSVNSSDFLTGLFKKTQMTNSALFIKNEEKLNK